ncbi:hypothetical protein [Luteimonas mephitis]|nr:hypothetical protein [Luteimonas mephitis]
MMMALIGGLKPAALQERRSLQERRMAASFSMSVEKLAAMGRSCEG